MTTMRTSSLALLLAAGALSCAAASTLLAACALHESASPEVPVATVTLPPAEDAGLVDADADASCTTDDCEYFPTTCAPDVLCPSGPFDPGSPTMALDWNTQINVIAGRSASDVWIAGTLGAVAHFDGTEWTPSDVGTQETQNILWLLDSAEVLLGAVNSHSRLFTRGLEVDAGTPVSPGGWSRHPTLAGGHLSKLNAAWSMPGTRSLWVATPIDLWRLRHQPGSTFEIIPGIPMTVCSSIPCRAMRSIHGASEGTVWAVGDLGAVVRITDADGATPTATPFNTKTWTGLSGVWAASDTDVWAVGGAGTILHYTGDPRRWEIVADVPTSDNLNAAWGTSPSDIWAVGDAGVVLHYDGSRWSRVKVAGVGTRRPNLYTVWSSGAGHVWIGGQGILLALGETQ